jgi:chondroitin AC lyase
MLHATIRSTVSSLRTRCIIAALCIAGSNLDGRAQQPQSPNPPAASNDLAVIKQRMIQRSITPIPAAEIQQLIDSVQADGSWPDINYDDRTRSRWQLATHLSRVTQLATACHDANQPGIDLGDLRSTTLRSLDYWLQRDFHNPNWWWNVIGVPRSMAVILLLIEDELSNDQRTKGLEILTRAQIGMTGQNLVWVAKITAQRGLLEANPELVKSAYERLVGEIRLTDQEGIQPDFSFHQHGPCLYNHGYGASFAVDCTEIAGLLAGTDLQLAPQQVDMLTSLLLDGSQWMSRGTATDFGAEGRETSRPGQDVRYLSRAATNLLGLPTGREAELRLLAARASGGEAPALTGNRHFWHSDMMTHHRADYYSSARMVSRRLANTDGPANSEGLLNHHISDGCHIVMRSGREYDDVFPVWDWQKIPGTTVALQPKLSGSPRRMGETDFVGGVSDGQYGMATMDLATGALQARKSWFLLDHQIVCLGSGIACSSDQPVVTTLNQCLLNGPVHICDSNGAREIERGTHSLGDLTWVWHDHITYRFMQPSTVELVNEHQTGSWRRINGRMADTPVTKPVFSLWIDQGKRPSNLSYAYIVHPGQPLPTDVSSGQLPPIQVLANSRQRQAIWHEQLGIAQVAFFEPGMLTVTGHCELGVDTACLAMVRRQGQGWSVSLANPRNQAATVRVTFSALQQPPHDAPNTGDSQTRMTFDLPSGLSAGATVTRQLKF